VKAAEARATADRAAAEAAVKAYTETTGKVERLKATRTVVKQTDKP